MGRKRGSATIPLSEGGGENAVTKTLLAL